MAVLDPSTRHRIAHSHVMTRCANKPLLWVIEELTTIDSVGGLSGPLRRVEYFLCLIMRLLQICPPPSIVLTMLRQDVHKYVRVAALVLIRLIGNAGMQREALARGWDDYRKIRVYGNTTEPKRQSDRDLTGAVLGSKRPRSAESAEVAEREHLEDLMSSGPPHYFLLRMDEVTDRLFGQGLGSGPKEESPVAADAPAAATPAPGSVEEPREARSFLGVPLPPLVLSLVEQ